MVITTLAEAAIIQEAGEPRTDRREHREEQEIRPAQDADLGESGGMAPEQGDADHGADNGVEEERYSMWTFNEKLLIVTLTGSASMISYVFLLVGVSIKAKAVACSRSMSANV